MNTATIETALPQANEEAQIDAAITLNVVELAMIAGGHATVNTI